jgi:hypothetical protein
MNMVIKMLEKVTKQARTRRRVSSGGGDAGEDAPLELHAEDDETSVPPRPPPRLALPAATPCVARAKRARVAKEYAPDDVVHEFAPPVSIEGPPEDLPLPPEGDAGLTGHELYHKTSLNVNLVNEAMSTGKQHAKTTTSKLSETIDALVQRYNRKVRYLATCEDRWEERAVSLVRDDHVDNSELAKLRYETRLVTEWARVAEGAMATGALAAHKLVGDMEFLAIAQVPFFLSDYNLKEKTEQSGGDTVPQDTLDAISLHGLACYKPERDSPLAGVKMEVIRSRFSKDVLEAAARVEACAAARRLEDLAVITAAVRETFRMKAIVCTKAIETLQQTRMRITHVEGEFARQLVPFRYVHRIIAL